MSNHRISPFRSAPSFLDRESKCRPPASATEFATKRNLSHPGVSHLPVSLRSVLVPVDGTSHGERALPLAASIAKQAAAQLRLLHVFEPSKGDFYPTTYTGVDHVLYRERSDYVSRLANQVADAADIIVLPECIRRQDIAAGIRETTGDADLVVATTQGFNWLDRAWRGSVIYSLLDQLSAPMLILRGDGLRASLSPDRWLRRMLLPLDGTPDAEEVLDPAMRLGSLYEADYSLLTLIVSSEFDTPAKAAHVLQHGRMTTEDYLTQVKNRLQQRSLSASAKVVLTEKSVASTILRQAEATRADCIAMTLGRRSGLKRLFQPSVTRRVIERSSVPVLVV